MTCDDKRTLTIVLIAAIGGIIGAVVVSWFLGPPPSVFYTYDATTQLCFARVRGSQTTNVVPCTPEVIAAARKR